jgi:hypothetical protein
VQLQWKSTCAYPPFAQYANARVPALQHRVSMTVHLYVLPSSGPCSSRACPLLSQKRSSALALAVGDGAREPPPSFTPPQSTSPSSPAQAQALSAFLFVPAPAQSAYIHAVDAEGGIQDEWVALTRNLTLLSAQHESTICGSREETMMVRISNICSRESISSELMTSRWEITCYTEPRRAPSTCCPALSTHAAHPAWCSSVTSGRD